VAAGQAQHSQQGSGEREHAFADVEDLAKLRRSFTHSRVHP